MNRFNLKELGKLLMQETERVSDGYHTFSELYEFRKMYNALLFNEWYKQGKYQVHNHGNIMTVRNALEVMIGLLYQPCYQQDKSLIITKKKIGTCFK